MELERGGRVSNTGGTTGHTHELSDLDDIDTAGALEGHLLMYTGGAWIADDPVGTVLDDTVPGVPTDLVITSTAYLDSAANPVALLEVAWDAPALNTDGSDCTDLASFTVRWRYTGGPWSYSTTTSLPSATVAGLKVNSGVDVGVMAVDTSGHSGAWSATSSVTTAKDATPPDAPSSLGISSRLGAITVTWDGLDAQGDLPPEDYSHTQLHMSTSAGFAPDPTNLVHVWQGAGRYTATGLTIATTYYFRAVSYDTTGNASAASGASSAQPALVVNTDIGTGAVDGTQVAFNARDIGGITTTISDTAPSNPKTGDVWLDTSPTDGMIQKRWGGSAWAVIDLNSASLAANSITATQLAAGAIAAGSAAIGTAAIGSAQIGSVDAGTVSTGFLDAARISAGSIAVDKLSVGGMSQENLVRNGGFEDVDGTGKPLGFTYRNDATYDGTWSNTTTAAEVHSGNRAMKVTKGSKGASGFYTDTNYLTPALAGEQYLCTILLRDASVATSTATFTYYYLDASLGILTSGTVWSGSITASYVSHEALIAAAPAGTKYLRLLSTVTWGSGSTVVFYDSMFARRAVTGSLIVDGAITAGKINAGTITADKIATKTITVDKLQVGGVSGNMMEDGGFEDAAAVSRMLTGSSSGPYRDTSAPRSGAAHLTIPMASFAQYAAVYLVSNGNYSSGKGFSCSPGEKVSITGWVMTAATPTDGMRITAVGWNAAGTVTTYDMTPTDLSAAYVNGSGGVYIPFAATLTVPSNTVYMAPCLKKTTTGTAGYWCFDDMVVTRSVTGDLIVDGAIDGKTITGGTIQTGIASSSQGAVKLSNADPEGYLIRADAKWGSSTLKAGIDAATTSIPCATWDAFSAQSPPYVIKIDSENMIVQSGPWFGWLYNLVRGAGETGVMDISTIASSGTTRTIVTKTAHGYTTGNSVAVAVGGNTSFDGKYTITVDNTTTFHYTATGSLTVATQLVAAGMCTLATTTAATHSSAAAVTQRTSTRKPPFAMKDTGEVFISPTMIAGGSLQGDLQLGVFGGINAGLLFEANQGLVRMEYAKFKGIKVDSGGSQVETITIDAIAGGMTAQGMRATTITSLGVVAIPANQTTYGFAPDGSPGVGGTFVAPLSGAVLIVCAAIMQAYGSAIVVTSYSVRTGATLGSGTEVLAGSTERGAYLSNANASGVNAGATSTYYLSGLTAGATYNIRFMHYNSHGTLTMNTQYRRLTIIPQL